MLGDKHFFLMVFFFTDSFVVEITHPDPINYMMQPENNEIFEIGDHNKRIPGKLK